MSLKSSLLPEELVITAAKDRLYLQSSVYQFLASIKHSLSDLWLGPTLLLPSARRKMWVKSTDYIQPKSAMNV